VRHRHPSNLHQFSQTGPASDPILCFGTGTPLRDDQVVGGPGWINSKIFDVEGKVGGSQIEQLKQHPERLSEEMRLRVHSLLADRFKLMVRRETREVSVDALVAAKGGPKLVRTNPEVFNRFTPGLFSFQPLKGPVCPTGFVCMRSQFSMVELASFLSRAKESERPVIDQTGLEGDYVIDFQYAHRRNPTAMVSAAERAKRDIVNTAPTGPFLFEAVQKQLGLKVKSTKGPVEFIIIEHIEVPTDR
jgi:uncharacterized protein (TIGR03435 family)